MNRTIVAVGIAVILVGVGLVSFPIVATGREVFDLEQRAGLLVAPVGLVVVMLGAALYDPRRTTVAGTFGNPEEQRHPERVASPLAPSPAYHPKEADVCRFCRTNIPYELANCHRCARARECRTCGRPLGFVLERATCPRCAREEARCNCPRLVRPPTLPPLPIRVRGS